MTSACLYFSNGLRQLYQIAANVFGLSAVVVNCSSATTLEDFSSGVLIPKQPANEDSLPKVGSLLLILNVFFPSPTVLILFQTQFLSSLLAMSSLHFRWSFCKSRYLCVNGRGCCALSGLSTNLGIAY